MNRKLKTKKKKVQEKELAPSLPKKRPMVKEKYKNPKNWLEEEDMSEYFQSSYFSPGSKDSKY